MSRTGPVAARTLCAFLRESPKSIDSSLQRLTCTSQSISDIDIHPAVLCALTANASAEVKELVSHSTATATLRERHTEPHPQRGSTASPSSLSSSSTQNLLDGAAGVGRDDSPYINIAVALTLHTVLLSRNRLTSLVGIVQFRNVVRLSLLGNAVRRIEDCEPLSLLPQLAFLSLEFNPVCALPHYRAHLLRITSWPGELTVRNCRLRKLDARSVRAHDIHHAAACLQREAAVLPELIQRHRLTAFAAHVEATLRMHREMRRRGVLLHYSDETVTLARLVERCAPASLAVADSTTSAHMLRRAVAVGGDLARLGTLSTPAIPRPRQHTTDAAEPDVQVIVQRVLTDAGGERDLDNIMTSALEVSVETRTSEDGRTVLSVLDGVSEICLEELSWAKLSLSNAEQSQHDAVCEEWSTDRFRATLSVLDVRLCTHLLRSARMLGHTLSSRDVDELCRVWLHVAAHAVPVSTKAVNATGTRRTCLPTVCTATSRRCGRRPPRATSPAAPEERPAPLAAVETVVMMDSSELTADSLAQLSAISAEDTKGGLAAHGEGEMKEEAGAAVTTARTEWDDRESAPLSTHSDILPRPTAPIPAPAARARPSSSPSPTAWVESAWVEAGTRSSMDKEQKSAPQRSGASGPREGPCVPSSSRSSTSASNTAPPMSNPVGSEDEEDPLARFLAVMEARHRRRAFHGIVDTCRRRRQRRQCAAYRANRLASCGGDLHTLSLLGLLPELSYLPRKAVFLQHWRGRVMEAAVARQLRTRTFLRQWRRRAAEAAATAHLHTATRARLLAAVFGRWKATATAAVQRRCHAARARLLVGPVAPAGERGAHPHFYDSLLYKALSLSPDAREPSSRPGLSPNSASPLLPGETPSPLPAQPPHTCTGEYEVAPPPALHTLARAARDPRSAVGAKADPDLHNTSENTSRSRGGRATASGTGAVVMSGGRDRDPGPCPSSRSPSAGLLRTPPVHPLPPVVTSPFSEEDVAALVEKASALQAGRELLVRRIVALQLEGERARVAGSRAAGEAAVLKERLAESQAALAVCEAEKDRLQRQVEHLKRCVERLRAERRDMLDQALSSRGNHIDTEANA